MGDRLLSGSFGISGSGHYELDAVREDSYAAKIAGEAREFRHAPSPLQLEVNEVLKATTIALVPIALIVLVGFTIHDKEFREAAQEATAGLVTLIPEGLVLLMSVTLAVAAVRLARQNTLVQQMAATEALAAVDTICVDKTGTLTDGTLKLIGVVAADPDRAAAAERALGTFAASAGERNRTLETIAERYPAHPERPSAEVPFSSQWKWSGMTPERHLVRDRRPRRARRRRRPAAARGTAAGARRAHRRRPAGDRLRRGARRPARRTRPPSRRRRSSRWRWWCSRRRCDPTRLTRSPTCATSRST